MSDQPARALVIAPVDAHTPHGAGELPAGHPRRRLTESSIPAHVTT
jgi:hypothetical protein